MLMLVLLIAGFFAALVFFWDLLTPFVLSAILACLLMPLVDLLRRRTGWKHGLCVAVVLVVLFALLGFLISLAVPAVIGQITALVGDLRRYAAGSSYEALVASLMEKLGELPLPDALLARIQDFFAQSDSYILSFLSTLLTSIVNFSLGLFDWIIGIILLVYFLLDGRKMVRSSLAFLPGHMQQRVRRVIRRGGAIAGKYIKSRLIISSGMAVVTFVGLTVIGLPYALVFAALSFFLDFIPYFGSIIAAVIEGFFALITGGFGMSVTVLVFVLIVQQVEGNVVAPRIEGDATGIHPVTVMFSLLACSRLWGPVGMLFSTPLAAVLKIVLAEAFAFVLGDDAPRQPEPEAPDKSRRKRGWSARSAASFGAGTPAGPKRSEAEAPSEPDESHKELKK